MSLHHVLLFHTRGIEFAIKIPTELAVKHTSKKKKTDMITRRETVLKSNTCAQFHFIVYDFEMFQPFIE